MVFSFLHPEKKKINKSISWDGIRKKMKSRGMRWMVVPSAPKPRGLPSLPSFPPAPSLSPLAPAEPPVCSRLPERGFPDGAGCGPAAPSSSGLLPLLLILCLRVVSVSRSPRCKEYPRCAAG